MSIPIVSARAFFYYMKRLLVHNLVHRQSFIEKFKIIYRSALFILGDNVYRNGTQKYGTLYDLLNIG